MYDEVNRAFRAYHRRFGEYAPYPSSQSNIHRWQGRTYVVLENCNGVLAMYRIRNDGRLKWIQRWPKPIVEVVEGAAS